jgi:hypothetical protein
LGEATMSLSPDLSAPTFDSDPRFADPIATMPSVNEGKSFWGEDGLRFGDVLDAINPLQHIPVVSTIYRNLTGDDISPGARIAGGTLFGGPIGFISGLFNSAVEAASGQDLGGQVLALLPGNAAPAQDPRLEIAAATPTPPANQAAAETRQESAAPPANNNALALAALQRDLRQTGSNASREAAVRPALATSVVATHTSAPDTEALPSTQAPPNIFAVPLPPAAGAASGATQPDGRKPGEYSAAELANILRAYKRAAEASGAPQTTRTPRAED